MNGLKFFVILVYFYIPSAESILPRNADGSPMPLGNNVIKKLIEKYPPRYARTSAQMKIWQLGLDVMKQYCQSDQCPSEFKEACKKVYKIEFGSVPDKNVIGQTNFASKHHLDRYLQRIDQENDLKIISGELQEAITFIGWNEIREFCLDERTIWYQTSSCKYVVEDILPAMGAWNLENIHSHLPTIRTPLLPKNGDGSPILLEHIMKIMGTRSESDVQSEIENKIWKSATNLLKKYCQSIQHLPKFTKACKKIPKIYQINFETVQDQNGMKGNNFQTSNLLHQYLERIEEENNLNIIHQELKEAVIYIGWDEIKQFCRNNRKWYGKTACKFVLEEIIVPMGAWNLEQKTKIQQDLTNRFGQFSISN